MTGGKNEDIKILSEAKEEEREKEEEEEEQLEELAFTFIRISISRRCFTGKCTAFRIN